MPLTVTRDPTHNTRNVDKLEKMVQVLMDQVEQGIDMQGNAFSLFQTAILLEDKIRERTQTLQTALRDLENTNRALTAAKEQTETAQTRLMEAIESISEGFVHFDNQDRMVLCNTKFLEFFPGIDQVLQSGMPFERLSRWTVETGLIVDIDEPREEWLKQRARAHHNPADPIVMRLATGRWLQVRERSTRDGGTVSLYTDITAIKMRERLRHEQELAEKSILLQSTLDNLAQGVSVFDRDLKLVAWNDRFRELLDLPDSLVSCGVSFEEYVAFRSQRGDYGSDADTAVAVRLDCVRRTRPLHVEQTLANGTVVEVRRAPMPGGGFVTTYTDITERKRAAEQLREINDTLERRVAERTAELTELNGQLRQEIFQRARVEAALTLAKQEAEAANLGKTKFLAAASHDLLQPLNAARLFVSALTERPLAAKEREFANRIGKALENVEALLATLMDISKFDAGVIAPRPFDFRIGEMLQALAEDYAPIAADEQVQLTVVPSALITRSDPALLARILRNLLSNAIRYSPGGRVVVGCRRRGHRVRIEVWDCGVGIPETQLQEIFEEFRQLNHVHHHADKSFGLGLAIAKRIARVLDHRIDVRSRLGHGSMFAVEAPMGNMTARHTAPSGLGGTPDHGIRGAVVLVIDNDESALAGMRELLHGWECVTIAAHDGEAAGRALRESGNMADLAIASYDLNGGMTGLETINAIRRDVGVDMPGILVSAERRPDDLDRVRSRGLHLLDKPIKPAKLRALMSHLLS